MIHDLSADVTAHRGRLEARAGALRFFGLVWVAGFVAFSIYLA